MILQYNGKRQVLALLDKYSELIEDYPDENKHLSASSLQTHVDVIAFLLQRGTDPTVRDSQGLIAADFDFKAALQMKQEL